MSNQQIRMSNRMTLGGVTHGAFVRQSPSSIRDRSIVLAGAQIRHDGTPIIIQPLPEEEQPTILPQFEDQNGNLFPFLGDETQMWYLPGFVLVEDPDEAFEFAATQTAEIDQETGSPFNKCHFTASLRKVVPTDAAAWVAAHPGGTLREIPLEDLEAAVVIQTVSQGVPHSTPYPATLAPIVNGTFLLTADNIIGLSVIALYQNLTVGNNAKCIVSAQFRARRIKPRPPAPPGTMQILMLRFETAVLPFSVSVEIGRKYQADPYRLKYTILTNAAPRVIINAADLRDFNIRQSEFVELHSFGNISARFPTVSKLYFGVVSKTIIVIPARYVILRESGICAARCVALVDSSPGLNSGCKFQIEFTLVPDVSSIDLLLLLDEINASSEAQLHGATLSLPRFFNLGSDAVLVTSFLTSFRYIEGVVDPHSISLSGEIKEQLGGTPAVANANLFLAQLRTSREPFLAGSIGIRLDDAFATPVDVPVLLNFTQTQALGSTGLTLHLDEPNQKALLENGTSLDLLVSRIALLTSQNVTVATVHQVIAASNSLSIDLPAEHDGLTLLSDCEIDIKADLSKSDLFRLVQFNIADVQNTQCLLSVNAAAVNFSGKGIDQIEITITLSGTPELSVATLFLMKGRTVDSTRILLPLVQTMVELNAVLLLKVSFIDGTRPSAQFTLQNDFGQHPIFLIADSDISV